LVTDLRNIRAVALLLALLAPLVSCGHGSEPPTSVPSSTPAPAPSPTPTPGGAFQPKSCASPPVGGGSCGTRPTGLLKPLLAQAIDEVRAQKDIFYPDGATIRYLDKARSALLEALDTRGLCGVFDFGDGAGFELYIRSADGATSEVYGVISTSGQLRTEGYQHSCSPPEPYPPSTPRWSQQDPECKLPASGATYCLGNNFAPDFSEDVRSSLVALTTERPELFDLTDSLDCTLCYRLMDPIAYTKAMVDKLHARGYCAMEHEELSVKKDDSLSENYDIVRSPGNLPYSYSLFAYKGRCHDASF
jgi:hypothetical protein